MNCNTHGFIENRENEYKKMPVRADCSREDNLGMDFPICHKTLVLLNPLDEVFVVSTHNMG